MEELSFNIKFTFDATKRLGEAKRTCYKLLTKAIFLEDISPCPLSRHGRFTLKEDANYYTAKFEMDLNYSLAKSLVFNHDIYEFDIMILEDIFGKGALGIEKYGNITVIKDNIPCTKENFYTLYPPYYKKTIRIDGVSKEIETVYLEDESEVNDWKLPVNNLGNDDQAMEDFNKLLDLMKGFPHLVRTKSGAIKTGREGGIKRHGVGYDVRFTQNAAKLTIVGTWQGSCIITYKPPHLKKFKDEIRTKQVI